MDAILFVSEIEIVIEIEDTSIGKLYDFLAVSFQMRLFYIRCAGMIYDVSES